jgi:hypothetical protein
MFKLELLNFVEHAGIEDYDMMTKVTITVACNCILWCKKSLKIPKGQLEAVNQRWTKRTKRQTMIYKTLHSNLSKEQATQTHKNQG